MFNNSNPLLLTGEERAPARVCSVICEVQVLLSGWMRAMCTRKMLQMLHGCPLKKTHAAASIHSGMPSFALPCFVASLLWAGPAFVLAGTLQQHARLKPDLSLSECLAVSH